MRTARQVCLAFLILFIAAARATGWPADYPQVRGIFPNADAYGEFEGTPPSAAIYQSGQLIGYVYLTSDVLRIPAYSGKPITTLVGIDTIGRIAGLAVVQHDEPILAVGISQERLARYVDQYAGKSVFDDVVIGARRDGHVAIDGISGATITVMVENATVMRSARMVAASRGIVVRPDEENAASASIALASPPPQTTADTPPALVAHATGAYNQAPAPKPVVRHAPPAATPQGSRAAQPASPPAASVAVASHSPALASEGLEWVAIWKNRAFDIAVLSGGLLFLFFILIFQDWLARDPTLLIYVRNCFHLYTLFFIGWWGLAQLSVINVLTFVNAVMHGFQWEHFLIDPMMFILWSFVAMTLLLWGRGVYCGWLCPFGALQELILSASRRLKLPVIEFSDAVHERLVALKYILLILLFGISLQSLAEAAWYAEVEPFKTVITMRFQREWQYVLYALILIGLAAVNRKFYCKYLCPLGAALAIPGRFRLFDWWLRRRKECGKPCQVCANQCSVRAVRPTGEINANECHYCLDCQVIYYDDRVCLPLIDRRKQRELRLSRTSGTVPDGGSSVGGMPGGA